MYKHLENKMCKELEALEEKYRTGMEMSEGDLRRVDLLLHSLKSMATYKAMIEAQEAQNYGGNSYNTSYTRGRDSMGRYASRDMGPDRYPPYYPEERRW